MEDSKLGLAKLAAELETNGVSSIKVKDGQIFAFTEEVLSVLLKAAQNSPEHKAIVFVKSGGTLMPD